MLSGCAPRAYDQGVAASLDRFLTRAIIALAFLIFGLVGGYVLASRFPGVIPVEPATKVEVAKVEPEMVEPAKDEPAKDEPAKDEPTKDEPAKVETGEGETGEGETGDGETGGGETGGETGTGGEEAETGAPAADAGEVLVVEPGPPPALSGKFVIEIRDLVGATRDKGAVRELATTRAHEIETCLLAPGNLTAARLHYQLAVNASGDVVESLMLQGVEPSVDACVVEAIARWNWGPTSEGSFFKLKFVWSA